MNPRAIKINADIYQTLDKFCKKHGFIRKALAEQAIIEHLTKLQERLLK